ncbi:MAG: IgGFc-binding protein, partial [Myxococcota bacterium]
SLTFTLQAGQYVQWELDPGDEMSGSVLQSDKPVAFTGAHSYICYRSATTSTGGCDAAHQMVPPVRAQGSAYVAAPYQSRIAEPESISYRLVGTVDGTALTFDPPIDGAPTSLNAGEVVDFESTLAFAVASQGDEAPFFVGQTMAGCHPNGFLCPGDDEYVNTLPPAQFLRNYVFFTDPSYETTNLVVTRVRQEDDTFADVTIECLGVIDGWQPVGTGGQFEVATVDLVRNGNGIMDCGNGRQEATSEGRFGITVWGLSRVASYAYPAGGNVETINDVVVIPAPQ